MKLNIYKQSLYALGAPAILLIVACSQFYFTQVYHLSQWKGGGFGMFSTVDSPGARLLRIYLEMPNGRVPVEVPSGMKSFELEIRTMPTHTRLCQLTQQMAQAIWVPYDYAASGKSINSSDRNSIDLQDDSVSTDDRAHSLPLSPITGEQPANIVTSGDHPLFRMLAGEETPPTDPILIYGVRVELWQLIFNRQNLRIEAEKYLECGIAINKMQK